MVATTVEHFGRLDILVNNAAVTFVGDLDIPLKRHEILMAINLTAPLVACHAAAPAPEGRGWRPHPQRVVGRRACSRSRG